MVDLPKPHEMTASAVWRWMQLKCLRQLVPDHWGLQNIIQMQGSKIFKDRVATADDPQVENLERNGAIIIGKSNMPEFGAGANTYNELSCLCKADVPRELSPL